jgi:ATP-dependent DNA helicase RecG
MLKEELIDLVRETQQLEAEQQTVEVKAANRGCPKRLYDTLSAFSNQDEGGIILFGLDESQGFDAVGVYDAQDLQKHVSEQCMQMSPEVRALFTMASVNGGVVVSAEIPGMDVSERPCFYEGKGRLKGSYKRVGDMDKPMTEYEIYSFEAFRKKYQDDIRIIDGCGFDTLDPSDLANYLLRLKANKPHLASLRDEQIYPLMSILKNGKVTLAAEWLFGYYPQAFAPQLCITAIKVFGEEKGALGPEGNRFEDNKRIEGTIPEMLDECLAFLRRNLSLSTRIDRQTGKRSDRFELPIDAVREVVLNALIHRDYSIHTEGMPIQVELYSDRLEVKSPGGLYGRLTVDKLGKVQPDTRNPVLATAMEVLGLTENRYSGIPTVRQAMKQEGKPEPEFIDTGSEFRVVLRMRSAELGEDNGASTREIGGHHVTKKDQKVLDFCSEPRSRQEIAKMLDVDEYYAARRYIKPLVGAGALMMTLPDKPRSKDQRYVRV